LQNSLLLKAKTALQSNLLFWLNLLVIQFEKDYTLSGLSKPFIKFEPNSMASIKTGIAENIQQNEGSTNALKNLIYRVDIPEQQAFDAASKGIEILAEKIFERELLKVYLKELYK